VDLGTLTGRIHGNARMPPMWDERYSTDDYLYGTEPNDFLREHAALIIARTR